ncbi:Uncharacterised protein [Klebsiella pneumoniae]|nr:Uncharacterised protein [Klebsiella pneumoniae]VUD32981.1 Uncharacterised protein [Raoultella sp. NCTC 9187]
MHIKTLIRQTDGDSRSHCGFAHTTFAHQHNQTVFTAGDIINQDRQRHILWLVLWALFRKRCYLSVFVEQAFQCGYTNHVQRLQV